MSGRRYAALDVGTNSTKLLVAELGPTGPTPCLDETIITRLGEGMQGHSRRLREAPMRRTLEAIDDLVKKAHAQNTPQIAAVGTAALREAENREEFLHRVKERCGLEIEVIPGEEEARLSYLAVRLDPIWRACDPLMVIDVGGGSTEVILGAARSKQIEARISAPLGAVRMTEQFLKSDPPSITQLAAANQSAAKACAALPSAPRGKDVTLVGVGGTVTNLGAMDLADRKVSQDLHGSLLSADRLEMLVERLAISTVEERRKMPGLDPRRADIILGGAILLSQAMAQVGASAVTVSTRGLRWGLLYDRFLPSE